MINPSANLVISVGGGKGGVGKSVLSSNLAVGFANRGLRTLLIDADLGAANQHTLFGLHRPGPGLAGFIKHDIETLEQAVVKTQVPNLSLLPGCGAMPGSANLNHAQKLRLLSSIAKLQADVLLIDVGAGISYNVLDLYMLSDLRLIVLLPQLTSFQNAYSFLKAIVWRTLDRLARQRGVAFAQGKETERVTEMLKRVQRSDRQLASLLSDLLKVFGAHLIGNQVVAAQDRKTIGAVSRMFHDFLNIEAPVLGHLRFSRAISESINERRPLLASRPADSVSQAVWKMAGELLRVDAKGLRQTRETLAQRAQVDLLSGDLDGAQKLPPPLAISA